MPGKHIYLGEIPDDPSSVNAQNLVMRTPFPSRAISLREFSLSERSSAMAIKCLAASPDTTATTVTKMKKHKSENLIRITSLSRITSVITEPERAIIHFKTRASPASRASHCYLAIPVFGIQFVNASPPDASRFINIPIGKLKRFLPTCLNANEFSSRDTFPRS